MMQFTVHYVREDYLKSIYITYSYSNAFGNIQYKYKCERTVNEINQIKTKLYK